MKNAKEFFNQVKSIFTLNKKERLYFCRILTIIMLIQMTYIGISAVGDPIENTHYTAKGMITGILMTLLLCILSYFSRKQDPNEKGIRYYFKLLWLKYRKWCITDDLKQHPGDLRAFRKYPQFKAWLYRKEKELKEVNKELENLVK